MPLTIIVATVYGRDMMTMSEMKTNDTMQKTTSTMNDASECVSARTCGSHAPSRMCTHAAKRAASITAKQNSNAAGSSDRHRASQTALSAYRMRLPITGGSR